VVGGVVGGADGGAVGGEVGVVGGADGAGGGVGSRVVRGSRKGYGTKLATEKVERIYQEGGPVKTYTVADVVKWGPCPEYTRAEIKKLIGSGKTALEILSLDIPIEDRIWAGVQTLSDKNRRLFACACARRVLPVFEGKYPEDKRPRQAINVSYRFANGKATEEELEEAETGAWAAARAAAAAGWAAEAAGWSGERDAWSSASAASAASAASGTENTTDTIEAAWFAESARRAEKNWQLKKLKEFVRKDKK